MQKMETDKIKRIVIWGLKKKYHTHRHIHQTFYKNAKKLGYPTLWLEDERKSQKYIQAGDLIITADPVGKMIPEKFTFEEYNLPVRADVFYCLHNIKDIFKQKLNRDNYMNLQIYEDTILNVENIEKWGPVTYFNRERKTLYQPWGTDLLPEEFKTPVYNKSCFVFWIGSVWNDALNRGNIEEIRELKEVLKKHKLRFIKLRFIPDFLNTFFVRLSKIAPAVAGKFQVKVNYLPCRMFKNISYGQLGITNIRRFKDILGESFIEGNTINEIVDNALSLSKEEYLNITKAQQEIIKSYTYKNALNNILRVFDMQIDKL
jgi:hypothetical protein